MVTTVSLFGPAVNYMVAIVAIAVATGVRLVLSPVLGDQSPFATLFLAILLNNLAECSRSPIYR